MLTEDTTQGKISKDFKKVGRTAASEDTVWPGQQRPPAKQTRSALSLRKGTKIIISRDRQTKGPGQLLQTKRKIRILLQGH